MSALLDNDMRYQPEGYAENANGNECKMHQTGPMRWWPAPSCLVHANVGISNYLTNLSSKISSTFRLESITDRTKTVVSDILYIIRQGAIINSR